MIVVFDFVGKFYWICFKWLGTSIRVCGCGGGSCLFFAFFFSCRGWRLHQRSLLWGSGSDRGNISFSFFRCCDVLIAWSFDTHQSHSNVVSLDLGRCSRVKRGRCCCSDLFFGREGVIGRLRLGRGYLSFFELCWAAWCHQCTILCNCQT